MAKYVMALDAGTTSNRCILFNEQGEICSMAQKEFRQFFPNPGWVEHDANEIWSTMLGVAVEAMNMIRATAADIAAFRAHGFACKLLAKELDIPVLLLSQLNRASDGSIDHRPTLSNLRESGAIEQDADMVMLLCRPALYGKTVDKKSTYPTDGLGIVIIAKHRNGKTGEVYFHHNQSMTKLVDYIPPLEWLTRNAK